jgi:hypothetical protein
MLLLAKSYGIEQGEEIRIGLQLAQEDLAQLLGASRQRVNQELKGFEREGAVRVEPTRLVVLSRDKLLDIAEAGEHVDIPWQQTPITSPAPSRWPQQHAFDTDALERYLSASLPGFAGPLTVEQFKGGQSNPTYKLITPGRQYVMRSKPGPLAKLLPSAHAIEREFRVMARWPSAACRCRACMCCATTNPSSAAPSTSCSSSTAGCCGTSPCRACSTASAAPIYDEMNRVLAALHNVEVRRWACPTSASPATTSAARSAAGASSTRRPSPSPSRPWTG